MIKVTALTANRDDPASRFRIRQFIRPLTHFGIDVREHYLPITRYRRQPLASLALLMRLPGVAASRTGDITWFRRELIPERFTLEQFTGGRRIFDVDDAIWLLSDSGFSEKIVAMCDGVTAGNHWLAEHYERLGKQVWVVPTSVDTDVWKPAGTAATGHWIVGWIGTASNLRYLQLIEEPLAQFLTQHPSARLRVVCDRRPALRLIPPRLWEFAKWSRQSEVENMQTMNVGLMPLEDSEWARGKCAFKMLLYMACGLPVVVSPVGVNRELLQRDEVGFAATEPNDWFESLCRLFDDHALSARLGAAGRKVVEAEYSVEANVPCIAKIFQQVCRQ
ncbi:MAG: glycosyltransferase family 4 protein [Pyrinomonadaceae bacterium]|nr:glycosyltransferase family 4 protein [Pyrinomonadaceae bacterium]